MTTRLLKSICRTAMILTLCALPVFGQTATITGTVTDASGAVVSGVSIDVINTDTSATRNVRSDGSGNYIAPALPVGRYRVEATAQGFQKDVAVGLTLNVNETVRVNLQLRPGAVNQSIEVTGAATIVQSETSTVGDVIDTQKVESLPLNGRRFESLSLLVPGVSSTNPSPGGGGALSISSGGGRFSSNNFRLDGTNNVTEGGGTGIALRPIVDAIQEFKIQTNAYSAEFGRGGGANIQVATKSGTNTLHGNAWEFLRNNDLDAKGFFDLQKQTYRRNQFGTTLGGPIRKNRTFGFFAYEGTRRTVAAAGLLSVPTPAFRSGNFAAVAAALKDPVGGGTFAGNQIPASRFSGGALAIQNYYPLPTSGLAGPSNYLSRNPQTSNDDQFNVRIDHRISDANTLFSRVATNKTVGSNPCTGPVTACVPGFPTSVNGRNSQFTLSDTHIFSAHLLNEFRGGVSRVATVNVAFSSSLLNGVNVGASLGIPGLPSSTKSIDWGMPTLAVTGFAGMNSQDYNGVFATIYTVNDTVTYSRGGHSVRTGIEIGQQLYNAQIGRARDSLTFAGNFTGNAYADFLLGYLSQSIQNPNDFVRYRYSYTYAAFLQDDWKLRNNLTLNIGLRYDYQTPDVEKQNRASDINPYTGQVQIAGVNGASRSLFNGDRTNFEPRIGFAYRPSQGLVVRGGYGIFYDVALQGAQLGQIKVGPPFFTSTTYNADNNPTHLSLANPFPAGVLQPASIFNYTSIQPDFKNGNLQQWNMGVQKSVGGNMVLEVGYIGSKGTHLYQNADLNQALLGTTPVQSRRPFPQYGTDITLQSGSNSSYNALISRFERRFSGGMTLLASYTWSHSIDSFSNSNPNGQSAQNSYNLSAERANSDFDVRQRLVLSYVYELPFGRGRRFLSGIPGYANALLGGWQVNGLSQFQSGNPVNVTVQGTRSNTGTNNLDRPNATGISPQLSSASKTNFLNPAAYALEPLNTFGNAGRNSSLGPRFIASDLSLAKKFSVEKWVTEFRAEFFNAFNHPLFAQPVGFINAPAFGLIQATKSDNRQIQFGLKLSR